MFSEVAASFCISSSSAPGLDVRLGRALLHRQRERHASQRKQAHPHQTESQRQKRVTEHWDEVSVHAQWAFATFSDTGCLGQLLFPQTPFCLPVRHGVPAGEGAQRSPLRGRACSGKAHQVSLPTKEERLAGHCGVQAHEDQPHRSVDALCHALSHSVTLSHTLSCFSHALCNCPSKFRVALC